jgi:SET domain-containing protein
MLLVKTKVDESPIPGAGKGLFADEFIPKGTPLWEFSPEVDETFTKEEVEILPEPRRSEILGLEHAYISTKTGKYVDCGDDARYVNHSENPTMLILYPDNKS